MTELEPSEPDRLDGFARARIEDSDQLAFGRSSREEAVQRLLRNRERSPELVNEIADARLLDYVDRDEAYALDVVDELLQMVPQDLLVDSPSGEKDLRTWDPLTYIVVERHEQAARHFSVLQQQLLRATKRRLDADQNAKSKAEVRATMTEVFGAAHDLMAAFDDWMVREGHDDVAHEKFATRVGSVLRVLAVGSAVQEARHAAEVAVSSADAAREASGSAAESSLAERFEALRAAEAKAAGWFRGAAIGLYTVTIMFAGLVAFGVFHHDAALSRDALQRLAPGIPTLLLAAYLGHQAKGHLQVASWAVVLVAQLQSIRAYTAELDDEDASQLRAAFGRRAFLESPGADPIAQSTGDSSLDVVAIMREAAAIAERQSRAG